MQRPWSRSGPGMFEKGHGDQHSPSRVNKAKSAGAKSRAGMRVRLCRALWATVIKGL